MGKTVLLIHGAFCGGWCFQDFVPVLTARGFTCHAPDLRFHIPGPAREPDPRLAQMSIADYTRDMAELAASFSEPPVIVGHSLGGIIGQQLAAKGLARALVLLAPGAPWGILPSTEDELALATGLMRASPFWDKALKPSFDVARQDSLASLDPEAQRRVFDQFSAESGRALFELFFGCLINAARLRSMPLRSPARCWWFRAPTTRWSPRSRGGRSRSCIPRPPSAKPPGAVIS